MSTILVIGSTGNIGSQVVKQLEAKGHKIKAFTRDLKKAPQGKNIEAVTGDLGKPETLDAAMKGVDAVFSVIQTGVGSAEQEKNTFTAAKKAGVKHFVKLSVAGASEESPIKLATFHGAAERFLKESGVPFSILQPTMFMQNQFGNIGSIKGEGKFYAAMKDGKVPLIDVADIAATAAAILDKPAGHNGKTYSLTGPEALSQADVAEKIGKAIGKTVTYVDLPPNVLVENLVKMGMPQWLSQDFGTMMGFMATGGAAQTSTDVETVTGRKPRSFDAFIADNAGAFK